MATEEYRVPDAGMLGRFFPFDPSLVVVPEAEVFGDDGREEYEVRFRQREGATSLCPGTERLPWYHRNTDFDEIAFYHGGSVFGIDMPPGLISHAPQGIHHGIPERARERARRRFEVDQRVEWQVIAIDTRLRLTATPVMTAAAAAEVAAEAQV